MLILRISDLIVLQNYGRVVYEYYHFLHWSIIHDNTCTMRTLGNYKDE